MQDGCGDPRIFGGVRRSTDTSQVGCAIGYEEEMIVIFTSNRVLRYSDFAEAPERAGDLHADWVAEPDIGMTSSGTMKTTHCRIFTNRNDPHSTNQINRAGKSKNQQGLIISAYRILRLPNHKWSFILGICLVGFRFDVHDFSTAAGEMANTAIKAVNGMFLFVNSIIISIILIATIHYSSGTVYFATVSEKGCGGCPPELYRKIITQYGSSMRAGVLVNWPADWQQMVTARVLHLVHFGRIYPSDCYSGDGLGWWLPGWRLILRWSWCHFSGNRYQLSAVSGRYILMISKKPSGQSCRDQHYCWRELQSFPTLKAFANENLRLEDLQSTVIWSIYRWIMPACGDIFLLIHYAVLFESRFYLERRLGLMQRAKWLLAICFILLYTGINGERSSELSVQVPPCWFHWGYRANSADTDKRIGSRSRNRQRVNRKGDCKLKGERSNSETGVFLFQRSDVVCWANQFRSSTAHCLREFGGAGKSTIVSLMNFDSIWNGHNLRR